jgi:hypothetical protein
MNMSGVWAYRHCLVRVAQEGKSRVVGSGAYYHQGRMAVFEVRGRLADDGTFKGRISFPEGWGADPIDVEGTASDTELKGTQGNGQSFDMARVDFDKACEMTPGLLFGHDEVRCLYDAARSVPAGSFLLEIGRYLGKSTVALACGLEDGGGGRMVSVDPNGRYALGGCPTYHDDEDVKLVANENSKGICLLDVCRVNTWPWRDRIELVTGCSPQEVRRRDESFDVAFVDGDHREEAAMADIAVCREKGVRLMLLHDYCADFQGVIDAANKSGLGEPEKVAGYCMAVFRLRK